MKEIAPGVIHLGLFVGKHGWQGAKQIRKK
jgi:hypothetical protein